MTTPLSQALKLIQSANWKAPTKRDAAPPAEKNIVIDGGFIHAQTGDSFKATGFNMKLPNIDWAALRTKKLDLIDLADKNPEHADAADELITLLDALQDYAVAAGIPATTVFDATAT
jgi:hypothetical protein